MIIYYEDDCAWMKCRAIAEELIVLQAVVLALPETPARVRIDESLEYVKVDEGDNWVEYYFDLHIGTSEDLIEGKESEQDIPDIMDLLLPQGGVNAYPIPATRANDLHSRQHPSNSSRDQRESGTTGSGCAERGGGSQRRGS